MISRSTLFLLPAGFEDGGKRQFCPECAEIWGYLTYFPEVKDALDIRYEKLAHPRDEPVALLGAGKWNCPTLVLADDAPDAQSVEIKTVNGKRYLDNARDIERYCAEIFGTPAPR